MTSRYNWKPAKSVHFDFLAKENFEKCVRLGVTELELSSGAPEPFANANFIHRSKEIVKNASDCGVNISSIHLPFLPFGEIDPSDSDTSHRKTAMKKQCDLIRAAGDAGIGIAVIHPSGEPYGEEERENRMQNALGFLGELTGFATAQGVTLAVENLPRTCLGRTSDELLYFLDRIPDLRACFDTNHSLQEDNCHFIRALGSRIVTLHVSDYDFIDERHLLPSEGKNPWQEMLAELEKADYNGRFLYELNDRYTIEDVAENFKKVIY